MRKSIAAMSLSATLLGGAGLGAVVFAPHLVGAAQTDTSSDSPSTDTTAPSSTEVKASKADRISEVLQPLVDDGTITADQRDAVVAALEEAGPIGGPGRGGHFIGAGLDAVAQAIGIDVDTLRSELQGSTIAEVAANHGVDVQTVIDTLVADANTRIDQAVADSKLTQERADAIKADLTQRITDIVNGEGPGPFGRPGFDGHGWGHGRPDRPEAPDSGDTGSDSGTTSTTGS
jgi:hypothetical protein